MMTTLEQITKILQTYKLESNVPWNHPYWELLTLHRAGITDAPERVYVKPMRETKAPPSGTPGQIQARLSQLRIQNRAISQSFGNREPDIPFTNDYWFTKNQITALERELAGL
jgi:hypothetical protein